MFLLFVHTYWFDLLARDVAGLFLIFISVVILFILLPYNVMSLIKDNMYSFWLTFFGGLLSLAGEGES